MVLTLNSLGFEASYENGTVSMVYNNQPVSVSQDSTSVMAGITNFTFSSQVIDVGSDILMCIDDVAGLFGFSKYFDGEDMCILSKEGSVYKAEDDEILLASLLKTHITDIIYASDSLGRKVKIASSTDKFKEKQIVPISVSAQYIPQPENPPEYVTDGDFSTRYAYDNNEKTLDIDLGEVKNISSYAISWYNGSLRKNEYVIHYSEDGIIWNSLPKVRSSGISDKYEFVSCPMRARYLKYQGFGTYSNIEETFGVWNSVTEIAFFEEVIQ